MNARARKQPEKRPAARSARGRAAPPVRPNPALAGLLALGRLLARHPSAVGGATAFAVVFSFVAANALWYQPGGHPAPLLKTRGSDNSLGFTATRPKPEDVTTFVIERIDEETELPEIAEVTPAERPFDAEAGQADPIAAAILDAEADPGVTSAVASAPPSDLVMQIQKGLSNIAYADIVVDGLAGEKTRTAIRHFEKHYRLPVTGEPNERVLAKLKDIGAL